MRDLSSQIWEIGRGGRGEATGGSDDLSGMRVQEPFNICEMSEMRLTLIEKWRTIIGNTARSSASKDVRAGFLFSGPNVDLRQALSQFPAATPAFESVWCSFHEDVAAGESQEI